MVHRKRKETTAVRRALAAAGIVARVTHGTGTASTWIHVYIGDGAEYGEHIPPPLERRGSYCAGAGAGCKRCQWRNTTMEKAEHIAAEASGRQTWRDNCIRVSA